ncbi:glycosyltransferase family 4 protein [Flagellimonas oceanensis]|uniref:glycosyltransferase family 4 protein n=1 Tax=Flagellimonas oceanensis TaxID=2499163 RepID=UPI003BA8C468
MRRLHLVSAMYVSKGHSVEYIRNFCENLKSEYKITLHIASSALVEEPEGIEVNYTGVNYKKTEAQNFVKFSKLGPYLRALTKQRLSYNYYKQILSSRIDRDDLIYIMDYDVLPLTYFIQGLEKKGVKNIYLWVHNAKFKSKDLMYTGYKVIFKYFFNRKIINSIKGVVVNGDFIKESLLRNLSVSPEVIHKIQYPSKIQYDKIPKAKAREKLAIGLKENVVLFFGMLRKDKNLELAIQSIAKSKCNVKLIVAGSEASITKQDINRWVSKYELKECILDIDYISEEKMALYYSCSDLLILTYNLESGSQSGPLSLAREFELPAVVTNTGEIGKYVSENNVGLVADLEGKGSFTKQIDCFFNLSEEKRAYFENNLRKAKEKYSWESAKEKYLTLFNA